MTKTNQAASDSTFTIHIPNPFSFFFESQQPEIKEVPRQEKVEKKEPLKQESKVIPKKEEISEFSNEFHRLYYTYKNDIQRFRDEYPLVTLISIVFFAFLGLSNLFQLNFTGILTCGIFWGLTICQFRSVQEKGADFWISIKDSILKIFWTYTKPPAGESNTPSVQNNHKQTEPA